MDNYKYLIPVLLVGYLIYRRIQKTIGFQKYTPARLKFRIALFFIVAMLILGLTVLNPKALIADAIGIILGLILVYFAMKNTIFEKRNDGLYYRTHIWVELTVLFLFFARLIYRFYKMYTIMKSIDSEEEMNNKLNDVRDPLTAGVFFIIFTYYIGYFLFLLKEAKSETEEKEIAN